MKHSNFSLWYTVDRPTEGESALSLVVEHRLTTVENSKLYVYTWPYVIVLMCVCTGWEYSSGFVSADMIAEHLPPPTGHTQILMCGPPPMIKFACIPNLEKLGYKENSFVAF